VKILNVEQVQKAERESSKFGISLDMLMQNAGKAVAERVKSALGDIHRKTITILIGPGNNGGDGLVAARHLHSWEAGVKVYICGKRPQSDPVFDAAVKNGVTIVKSEDDPNLNKLNEWLLESDAVVDAVFGTGNLRKISGTYYDILSSLNHAGNSDPDLKIIALDLPAGLNADSGDVDEVTPFADETITLGFPKIGLFNMPGAEHAGRINVADIGIPAELVDYVNLNLLTEKTVKPLLPCRSITSHKGTYGKVLALTGSKNYPGAAYLACSGAIRSGSGLTTLAITENLQPVLASKLSETTYLPLSYDEEGLPAKGAADIINSNLVNYNVLLTGCGLGQTQQVKTLLKSVLIDNENLPEKMVIDADGLNFLSEIPEWQHKIQGDVILTPHPGEMSRLTGLNIGEIQSNRLETAARFAEEWGKTVVLKGAYTVICSSDGRVCVSPFANAGLSSAGTGDVLSGTIAGFLAQGLNHFDAAVCGVYIHALAAEIVKERLGDCGMTASDLFSALPQAIRQLRQR
jgi:ADP-dependent NAD(P)H-hydrate dehydratase / NAD(P)H-hydrate epimerase